MNIDKEMIQKAVDEALEKVLEMQDEVDNSDEIIDTVSLEDTADDSIDKDKVSEEMPENSTMEKVEEKVEEAVDDKTDYNFLGLDIKIDKNGEKFDITIKKDDKEKTESLDSADLPAILGLVEDFFNELVLDEDLEDAEDEEEEVEEIDKEDSEKENEEDSEEEDDDEDEEDEEDEDSNIWKAPKVTMSSLRRKYKDRINQVFEHGLLAKEMAFDMVKDKLVASTVKELIDKNKEKESVLAEKKAQLKQASLNYLIAKKLDSQYNKLFTVLSSSIADVQKDLTDNKINPELANKTLASYKIIIAKVLAAKKPETLIAAITKVDEIKKVLLAKTTIKETKVVQASKTVTKDIPKKEIKNVVKPVNILNRNGWKGNTTLLAKRYDGIEEMSAEILRIAGIDEEE